MDSGSSVSPGVFRIMTIQSNTASNAFFTSTYLDDNSQAAALKTGDTYQFRVAAINVVGDSQYSEVFSAIAATLPSAPGTPTRLGSGETTIAIQWTAPSDDGGSPILDYTVMWD